MRNSTFGLIAAFFMTMSPLSAQTVNDFADEMQLFSLAENNLLEQRAELIAHEQSVKDPIWLRDELGVYRIISGKTIREGLKNAIFIAQTLDLDAVAISQLPFMKRVGISLLKDGEVASLAEARAMAAIMEFSRENRRTALVGLDNALELARSDFLRAMQNRDALLSGESLTAAPDIGVCSDAPPANATFYVWRTTGLGTDYWAAGGGIYCEAYSGAYARVSTTQLEYFQCSDRSMTSCKKSEYIYLVEPEDSNGIADLNGLVYANQAALDADNYASGFSWKQR